MIHKTEILKIIESLFNQYPQDYVGSVSEKEMNAAEIALGIAFNNSYKDFILKYGGACIGSKFIYGLRKHRDMGNDLNTVLNVTEFYRSQSWPNIDDWVIISDDFSGNPIGITPDGKIWLSDHDSSFEHVKLADSFEEFLYKLHTDTLFS